MIASDRLTGNEDLNWEDEGYASFTAGLHWPFRAFVQVILEGARRNGSCRLEIGQMEKVGHAYRP